MNHEQYIDNSSTTLTAATRDDVGEEWVELGQEVIALAGMDQLTRPMNTGIVRQWLADYDAAAIRQGVKDVANAKGYNPHDISSLSYFTKAIETAFKRHAEKITKYDIHEVRRANNNPHVWRTAGAYYVTEGGWRQSLGAPPDHPKSLMPTDIKNEIKETYGTLERGGAANG